MMASGRLCYDHFAAGKGIALLRTNGLDPMQGECLESFLDTHGALLEYLSGCLQIKKALMTSGDLLDCRLGGCRCWSNHFALPAVGVVNDKKTRKEF